MKLKAGVFAFALASSVANAAGPVWLDATVANNGKIQVDANSVRSAGNSVQFWVREYPNDATKQQFPNVAYMVMHINSVCGAPSFVMDQFVSYAANDTVTYSDSEPQSDPAPPGSSWEYIIGQVCSSQNIPH
ncbi:surface-adhesin E family protein [Paraburkholderia graminis]|uniref:surface-adhesin E family protein n=1 Tax=Paraburkholderia graminis TaxID=60548 RepID=UPI0038B754A5